MNLIDKIYKKQINPNVPEFRVGDTVRVGAKSDEYYQFLKKANINNGLVVDLKLFFELENGVFKVYVPF